jgi:hypothetical protein
VEVPVQVALVGGPGLHGRLGDSAPGADEADEAEPPHARGGGQLLEADVVAGPLGEVLAREPQRAVVALEPRAGDGSTRRRMRDQPGQPRREVLVALEPSRGRSPAPTPPSGHPTRVAAGSISERDLGVARAVQEVADGLGTSPSRVALAWTTARSRAVHPIVGARRLEQLLDNLGAADLTLPSDALARLDAAGEFDVGFPHDFIRDMQGFVFGEAGALVDP